MVNAPLFCRQSCIFYTDFSEHHQRVVLFSCCMPFLQTPAAAYCLIFVAHKLGLGISFCASDWFLVFFPFYPTSLLVKQEPSGNVFSCVCGTGVGPEAEQADLQHAWPRWLCDWTQLELRGLVPPLQLHGQHRLLSAAWILVTSQLRLSPIIYYWSLWIIFPVSL